MTELACLEGDNEPAGDHCLMALPATLHERFHAVCAAAPHRVAVSDDDRSLSYAEVAGIADKIAQAIAEQVRADERLVALRTARNAYAPAAIIGILQAGCGYLPVDPDYPSARQEYLLGDSGCALVITDGDIRADEEPVACVGPFTVLRRPVRKNPALVPPGTAYVIYTSGSTGAPKGCVVGHEHVLALFDAAACIFDFSADDVWTVFHSYSFDFSVWELWGALLYGGRAVQVSRETAADPALVKALLARESVTVLSQVPSFFGFLAQECELSPLTLPALRHLVFGGEAVNPDDIRRWWAAGAAPAAEITNMYGITETTIHVTYCRLTSDLLDRTPAGLTPIGVPLPHLAVRLMDEQGQPVPAGEPGEMWVSGRGVTHGYLNRAELTRSRFVTSGHSDGTRERFYRSGDHAVRRADGGLSYIGRRDHQVKLRGFRIELGEIESALRSVPGIKAAACALEKNGQGDESMVAYVVPLSSSCPSSQEIQAELTSSLPEHMRPQRIKRLARLPISDHGKLDREALRAMPLLPGEKCGMS